MACLGLIFNNLNPPNINIIQSYFYKRAYITYMEKGDAYQTLSHPCASRSMTIIHIVFKQKFNK
jgi:hypothetical protein